MIDATIGIYLFAWWGVFWLLIPRESSFRFWAFAPAAICAFAVPCLVGDFVSNPDLGIVLGCRMASALRHSRRHADRAMEEEERESEHTSDGICHPADGLPRPSR